MSSATTTTKKTDKVTKIATEVATSAPAPSPVVAVKAAAESEPEGDNVFGSSESDASHSGEEEEEEKTVAPRRRKASGKQTKKEKEEQIKQIACFESFIEAATSREIPHIVQMMAKLSEKLRDFTPAPAVEDAAATAAEKAPRRQATFPIPELFCVYTRKQGIVVKRKDGSEIDLDGEITTGEIQTFLYAFINQNREKYEEARIFKMLPDGRRAVNAEGNPVVDGNMVQPHAELKKEVFDPIVKLIQAELKKGEESLHHDQIQKLITNTSLTEKGAMNMPFHRTLLMSLVSFLIPQREKKAPKKVKKSEEGAAYASHEEA